jgi:hypothetical protein
MRQTPAEVSKRYHEKHHDEMLIYYREYHKTHKEQIKIYNAKVAERRHLLEKEYRNTHPMEEKIRHKSYHAELRIAVINHYGGKCVCCGENNIEFLAIDHIDGGGNKHRNELGGGGSRFYLWARKNNYPEGYQVLCHNCNMAKGFYGECPHERMRNASK